MKIFVFILLIIFDIGFLINFPHYDLANQLVTLVSLILTVLVGLYIYKVKQKERAIAAERQQYLESLRDGMIPRIDSCSLILKEGEYACAETNATFLETENRMVGTSRNWDGSSRTSFFGGMVVRSGSSMLRNVYENITSSYQGKFTVTNQRLSFISSMKNFEIPCDQLTAIHTRGNQLILQKIDTSYVLHIKDVVEIEQIIRNVVRS
ncbi:MAG: hypothetical protein KHZ62_11395 [Clostridiales bacterium]|nr:hypothetical protein [Clostridiales bacterium]